VAGQLGLGGAQQPHLGGDLGGQISEGDRGVIAVQLQGGVGGGTPLLGPGGSLMPGRCLGDQLLQPGWPGGKQHAWIGVAFQHGQVGLAEVAGKRAHR
jgi:hypothetical protein